MEQKNQDKIDSLLEKENWPDLRNLLLDLLKEEPDDHWLLTRLGLTYYEEKNYQRSYEISSRALSIAPNCPLVIWDHAGDLDMLGKEHDAIRFYEKLLKRDLDDLAYGECGEGMKSALRLKNDSRYRIAICYYNIGETEKAVKYMEEHLSHRKRGQPSAYTIKEVRKDFETIKKT